MAKSTATRAARKFLQVPYIKTNKLGQNEFAIKEAKLPSFEQKPAQPREARPCRYCHKPMMVSAGQVVYFHSECRRKKRDQRGQGNKGR